MSFDLQLIASQLMDRCPQGAQAMATAMYNCARSDTAKKIANLVTSGAKFALAAASIVFGLADLKASKFFRGATAVTIGVSSLYKTIQEYETIQELKNLLSKKM